MDLSPQPPPYHSALVVNPLPPEINRLIYTMSLLCRFLLPLSYLLFLQSFSQGSIGPSATIGAPSEKMSCPRSVALDLSVRWWPVIPVLVGPSSSSMVYLSWTWSSAPRHSLDEARGLLGH